MDKEDNHMCYVSFHTYHLRHNLNPAKLNAENAFEIISPCNVRDQNAQGQRPRMF